MPTKAQYDAIEAAVRRVYPNLSDREIAIEIAWNIHRFCCNAKGAIMWRRMEIGEKLLVALAEAQNWRCCYCGVRTNPGRKRPTLEHFHRKSRGGADHPSNLVMACFDCNSAGVEPGITV